MKIKAPKKLIQTISDEFLPAPELAEFVKAHFHNEESKLYNADHRHLRQAKIAYLWTNVSNSRQMRNVVATAEIPKPPSMSSKWQKAKYLYQLRQWFGDDNFDFLITLNARHIEQTTQINAVAILDHELYHCGHKVDEFGQKEFSKTTGKPKFALLGHSVEEFTGIIRRYGVGAGAGETIEFVVAAKVKPEIGPAELRAACGNCVR